MVTFAVRRTNAMLDEAAGAESTFTLSTPEDKGGVLEVEELIRPVTPMDIEYPFTLEEAEGTFTQRLKKQIEPRKNLLMYDSFSPFTSTLYLFLLISAGVMCLIVLVVIAATIATITIVVSSARGGSGGTATGGDGSGGGTTTGGDGGGGGDKPLAIDARLLGVTTNHNSSNPQTCIVSIELHATAPTSFKTLYCYPIYSFAGGSAYDPASNSLYR